MNIHYTVSMLRPETHRFHVSIAVSGWEAATATLVMPSWIPGSYLIRDFARHVENFDVHDGSHSPVEWERRDKDSWEVKTEGKAFFRVTYEVYANELSVRTSHLDDSHGYFNGPNILMYVEGHLEQPVTLSIRKPATWQSSIALPKDRQGNYVAENYDRLADSPAEIGTHRLYEFEALGKPHQIAIWGHGNEDGEQYTSDVKRIVETTAQMFGDELPYDRYLFILHLSDNLRGGLEHKDSTTIHADRWTFKPRNSYLNLLRLTAHEFFHTWHVKRIRPHNLGPFDYTKEVYTPLLWVMEGFTSYYDHLLMRRADLMSVEEALGWWGDRIGLYVRQPGRHVQSVEESSLTTWIKYYRQDENYVNSGISYYLKGALVGLLLDLNIRHWSQNERSLDTVMARLWEDARASDDGFTLTEFEALLNDVAGRDLGEFLERFVRGVEEIPLSEAFALAGLQINSSFKDETPRAWIGIRYLEREGHLRLTHVLRDTPAEQSGLMVDDTLLAIDGFEVRSEAFLAARLRGRKVGDTITLHLFRRGRLVEKQVALATANPDHVELTRIEQPTALQQAIYASWLAAPWPGA
ncbi:MAG: M61 family metallopeptidase [Anaerolineales bacterium]|nr:M61 family metallopeptidase [Anaerolineales bacterium]